MEETDLCHPHLSLAQIHSALGYYDHKPELDAEIEAALHAAEELRAGELEGVMG